jgi:hypothetical protein
MSHGAVDFVILDGAFGGVRRPCLSVLWRNRAGILISLGLTLFVYGRALLSAAFDFNLAVVSPCGKSKVPHCLSKKRRD